MAKNLVIVESPAKAKTIEKFLGKDFTVKSSFGHIRDLPKSGMSIDVGGSFLPTYEISNDKKKVVSELKKEAKQAEMVWLASDEDREGEAIAWHLSEIMNLPKDKRKRIVFHEITKTAIEHAIENPRDIDQHLVDAQQARRVLDRIVGYELSPLLWKKIRTGLSAGRVQSVAVRLIVDREREIESFVSESSFRITADFEASAKKQFGAEIVKKFLSYDAAKDFVQKALSREYFVQDVEKKPAKRSPAPPFTTSTLQQEAARKLGFSVKKTMMLSQRLYEAGKITYMRTDSVNLSSFAISAAKSAIIKNFGEKYHHTRQYKTKSAGAQEAHEAIRPTSFFDEEVSNERDEQRLYDLIWKRAIASQMSDASLERTIVKISEKNTPSQEQFVAKGEVLLFDGFLKVYLEGKDEEDDEQAGILPPLEKGEVLKLLQLEAKEGFSRPPARYNEAALVRTMEERGIGRPSTYAPTISTIQDRGYIEKEDREGVERELRIVRWTKGKIIEEKKTEITGSEKAKLFPTPIGTVVTDFLVAHFSNIVDYQFTKKVEEEFDDIAEGKTVWNTMIQSFYSKFHESVIEKTESVSREEAIQERILGNDPVSGKPISVRVGRFGPYVQIGTKEDEEKPLFASLQKGQNMDLITLTEALELFRLPRTLGEDEEGNEIIAKIGRFGPYVQVGKLFVSLKKDDDPLQISLERAKELIAEKKKANAEKTIKVFEAENIQILKGQWGAYITDGKKNAKIPKDCEDPSTLSVEECQKLLESAPAKKKGGRWGRKKK
jgi:DNA topoisomerase I